MHKTQPSTSASLLSFLLFSAPLLRTSLSSLPIFSFPLHFPFLLLPCFPLLLLHCYELSTWSVNKIWAKINSSPSLDFPVCSVPVSQWSSILQRSPILIWFLSTCVDAQECFVYTSMENDFPGPSLCFLYSFHFSNIAVMFLQQIELNTDRESHLEIICVLRIGLQMFRETN